VQLNNTENQWFELQKKFRMIGFAKRLLAVVFLFG
jgi:hypothetical protein